MRNIVALCCIQRWRCELPARGNEPARQVKQVLHAAHVTLCPPDRKRKTHLYHNVEANVIIATEIGTANHPIEWVLLTNVPIPDAKRVQDILQWYLCRWQIEVYFRILKSGCRVEKLQLATAERFDACFTLYMIIAWRILYITMLAREVPEMGCEMIFSKVEWQSVYCVINKQAPPKKPPSLKVMIKMLACLGGYLNRKQDGEPGPTRIWIGLQRLRDFIIAQEALRSIGKISYG